MRTSSIQSRLGRALDDIATVTSRKRVRRDDKKRHDLNGHEPATVLEAIAQLERQAKKIKRSI